MQITLVQGLLIALLVFICAIDKHMETFMWFRPLVVAFFTGIILGDVRLGMQAGAVAELSYLGLLTVGGTVPPDPLFAGLMTTVLAYTTGCDVNTALGLAVPFALIGQWINTGTNTFYAGFLPKVDKCAAAGDEKGIAKVREILGGGADAALECVGTEAAVDQALGVLHNGGRMGFVGVPHYENRAIGSTFGQNTTIGGGPASVTTYDKQVLLKAVLDGDINPGRVFTTSYKLEDINQAYKDMDERKSIKSMIVIE